MAGNGGVWANSEKGTETWVWDLGSSARN